MRVLIAGTGSIGQRHICSIQGLDSEAEFTFLRRENRQNQLSTELSAIVISSIEEVESNSFDYAVVATPSALHTELVLALIKMGVPMYVEKPVVTRFEDIIRVREALSKHQYKAATLTGCNLRFLPTLIKVKDMLDGGVIGNVVRATFQVGQWLPDWRPQQDYTQSYSAKSELGGGVIMDLIHELDAARWLLGDFDNIHTFVSDCASLDIQSEAVACIIMKGNSTPLVSVNLDYVSRKPVRRYEFIGDEGTIVWDLTEKLLVLRRKEGDALIDCEKFGFDVVATYKAAMASLLKAVEVGGLLEQDIYEGLKSVELALKVKEAANK